jgi:hypothetical protein
MFMYLGAIVALSLLAGLIWWGLQGWERLVRIRREQLPDTS